MELNLSSLKMSRHAEACPGAVPATAIPNNLPHLQSFFARVDELAKISEALDPSSRTWGALLEGPAGIGKTSLAVRAAYACTPEQFDRIIFFSIWDCRLEKDSECLPGTFLIPGVLVMLNQLGL